MIAKEGDVYTVFNKNLRRYTACMVAYIAPPDGQSDEPKAVILSLDWQGDKPLEPEGLTSIKPLYKDFMYWPRELHLLKVSPQVPDNYILVGNRPPLIEPESCNTFGFWDEGKDVYYQFCWQQIPLAKRQAFKRAIHSDKVVSINGHEVKECSHAIFDSTVSFGSACELNKLPCLSTLHLEHWHDDLIEFLQSNPFIHELTLLNHGQSTLDLRGCAIRRLLIDMTGLKELYLDERVEFLLFQSKGEDNCLIHAYDQGSMLSIQFIEKYRPHHELVNLQSLHGIDIKDFDLSSIVSTHANLQELRLWGKPGLLTNFAQVREFKKLERFSTYDLFGFSKTDIPSPKTMPKLNWFWMTSLPQEAAKAAKVLWKDAAKNGVSLRITKARKDEWLAQNVDNPFRFWDGAEHLSKSAAQKAKSCYQKTRAALIKIARSDEADCQEQALEIVRTYTMVFNAIKGIETTERDEIYEALRLILRDLPPGNYLNIDELLEEFELVSDF